MDKKTKNYMETHFDNSYYENSNIIESNGKLNKCTDDDSSTEINDSMKPRWGWLIIFASFICHFIADGCSFTFGIVYIHLLEHFQESKGKTSLVGALFVSIPLLTGPIASYFITKYGCQKSTIAGGIIAPAGYILSAYVDSVEMLCFTFGIISGFGLSLIYVAAIVIVAQYFPKHTAFATGLAVSGSGFGTFVFAPLTEAIIEEYTWKGACLIIGGLMFNFILCGLIFRPLPDVDMENSCSKVSSISNKNDTNDSNIFSKTDPSNNEIIPKQRQHNSLSSSLIQLPIYLQEEPLFHNHEIQTHKLLNDVHIDQSLLNGKTESSKMLHVRRYYNKELSFSCPNVFIETRSDENHIDFKGSFFQNPNRYFKQFWKFIYNSFDLGIFKSYAYVIFVINGFLLYMWYDVPYVYAPDLAIQVGVSQSSASFLLSVIGIFTTIGQITTAYIADFNSINILKLYNILTCVAGLATLFYPVLTDYVGLVIISGVYGFFISANYALSSVILIELVGMKRMTNAFGILSLFEGLANLAGPPIAGCMTDKTNSYDAAFYTAGAGIILSGLILWFIPIIKYFSSKEAARIDEPQITNL